MSSTRLSVAVRREGADQHSVRFDATVIGDLPDEVCQAKDGTDGVTQSCTLPGTILLPVENISWEVAPSV